MRNKSINTIKFLCIISICLLFCSCTSLNTSQNSSSDIKTDSPVQDDKNSTTTDNSSTNKDDNKETTHNNDKEENPFKDIETTTDDILIPVLCYHDVIAEESDNDMLMLAERFEEEIKYLHDNGYTSITMDQLYDYLENNKEVPKKSVVITFDDGYIGNYTYAYPILKKYNMHATIFAIPSMLQNPTYLNEDQLRELSDNNIEIQSHTFNHEHLSTLTEEEQFKTLKESKESLEKILGKEVNYIAYPYGESNADSRKAAEKAGYKLAFSLNGANADRSDNVYNVDRLYMSNNYSLEQFINKIENSPRNPQ